MKESFPTTQPPGSLRGTNYGESLTPCPRVVVKAVTSLCGLFTGLQPSRCTSQPECIRRAWPGGCSWHAVGHCSFREAEWPEGGHLPLLSLPQMPAEALRKRDREGWGQKGKYGSPCPHRQILTMEDVPGLPHSIYHL